MLKRALLVLLLPSLLLWGCKKKEETIKVAIAGPMTGPQAKMGKDFRNAVELALREWNERGGVLGKKVVLTVGDDQADPKQAVSVANKFVTEGVAGVVGHFNSSCSIPASDIYNRAGVPMITPASTNPLLTERGYGGVFRVCGRDDQQGAVAARFVIEGLKLKKAAVLHDKTTYGQGLAEEFMKSLGEAAQTVYYGGVVQGEKDFKTVITSAMSKKPEFLYFGGIYPEAGLIVKQARELGHGIPFISGDGAIDPIFIQIAGEAAEGSYLTFSPDPEKIPSAKGFIQKYKSSYGDPGPYSVYAYDAVNILLSAIKEAGSTGGKAVSEKIHSGSFSGALGPVGFDEKGDVTAPAYVVWVTKGGKFEEFWRP